MQQDGQAKNDIWAKDLLNREKEGRFLINFLTRRIQERAEEGRPKSYVLNLDAGWGEGKTHFLNCLKDQLESENYLVSYVNAWRDDHADTPLVAVMSAIESSLKPYFKKQKALNETWKAVTEAGGKLAVAAMKGAARQTAKQILGAEALGEFKDAMESAGYKRENLEKAADTAIEKLTDTAGELLLRSFRDRSASIEIFKNSLEKILEKASSSQKRELPLFVLVDELDRCRPTYAISMLEQIKHLFEINNVVFVIATDSRQLAHAIRAVYGSSFESEQYLKRFFDRKYIFEKQSMSQYVQYLFHTNDIPSQKLSVPHHSETAASYFLKHMEIAELSLRDAYQCMDLLRNVATLWDRAIPIHLIYLLPLIIAHHMGRDKWFSALTLGAHNAENLGGVAFNWTYKVPNRGRQEEVTNESLLMTLLHQCNSPLWSVIHEDNNSIDGLFAREIFYAEFAILQNENQNSIRHRDLRSDTSILKSYPSFVRSAGRLSQRQL